MLAPIAGWRCSSTSATGGCSGLAEALLRLVLWISLVWLVVLGSSVARFLKAFDRQDQKLELLLERTAPALPGQSTNP